MSNIIQNIGHSARLQKDREPRIPRTKNSISELHQKFSGDIVDNDTKRIVNHKKGKEASVALTQLTCVCFLKI
jgi:hypothetical protein